MPNTTEKRTQQVGLKFTRSEYSKLVAAAIVVERDVYDWARRALLKAANLRRKRA